MNTFTFQQETQNKMPFCYQDNPFSSYQLSSPRLSGLDNQEHPAPALGPWTDNPTMCDLQDVLIYYQSQPELLQLILMSKLEEDKRRAEEAKLRTKELDLLLLQQQQFSSASMVMPPTQSVGGFVPAQTSAMTTEALQQHNQLPRRSSMEASSHSLSRRNSTVESSLASSEDTALEEPSPLAPTPFSSSTLLFQMPRFASSELPADHSVNYKLSEASSMEQPSVMSFDHGMLPPSPPHFQGTHGKVSSVPPAQQLHSRRRREMQPISKIVETREYPYDDGYFWKNNGNTVQKKTGNKSVYYKCSNSSKGCTVNKTVTWRENGDYLIKYRGEHLVDCGRVQRIVDV